MNTALIAELRNCETNTYLNCCSTFNSKAIQGRSKQLQWTCGPYLTRHMKESLTERGGGDTLEIVYRSICFLSLEHNGTTT